MIDIWIYANGKNAVGDIAANNSLSLIISMLPVPDGNPGDILVAAER